MLNPKLSRPETREFPARPHLPTEMRNSLREYVRRLASLGRSSQSRSGRGGLGGREGLAGGSEA